FLLYDYTFCPDGMDKKQALAWAAEHRVVCTDEFYLSPSPHATREAWCHDRLRVTEERLAQLPPDVPTVLVNHFQLRLDLVRLPRVPRFCVWCGTRATEDWHIKWRAKAVVSGHLHMRSTDWRDGVRFEEVALGYPRDWKQRRGIDYYIREVLPGSKEPGKWSRQTVWHR
ncbi:MAG TPA: metallophosphoesterase, partial [Deltaproteobacteria bacterium]|nr:metallophosphoesterase [Deltaproteobacteria bacterium]